MATATNKIKKTDGLANYTEAVGRRKTAIARVRVSEATKNTYVVNGKELSIYFPTADLQSTVAAPLSQEGFVGKYTVSAHVQGGGIRAQAEAIRHAISRTLVKIDPANKSDLKKLGFIKRDARKKERKHFGLKKARKASQWSKR
jgi:small subunit ribosomal protein S9